MLHSHHMEEKEYPIRINKYLARQRIATRVGADELVRAGKVRVNGKRAVLGQMVQEGDKVEVVESKQSASRRSAYRYLAYNKPRGIVTHSPQKGEQDILAVSKLKGVSPIGRLDKDSSGLIILTNDGRVTDRLLNPKGDHEKEYAVQTTEPLRESFKKKMEQGVKISDEVTKPCKVRVTGERTFRIVLTEGKKHQIRRMVSALFNGVHTLKRVRIGNIKLERLASGAHREIEGAELSTFLKDIDLA